MAPGVMKSPLLIGIDGGGTKTDAILLTPHGDLVARATGGPSNYQDVGRHAAVEVWSDLLDVLTEDADGEVLTSAWGLSGWDRPRDAEILSVVIRQVDRAPDAGRDMVNDAFLALRAGSVDGRGVAVISGTGSNCCGVGGPGQRERIGGLAYEFGDSASGTDIGRDGLRAAFRGEDGRAPRTLLIDLLYDRYDLERLDDIVDLFVEDADDPANPGVFAPLVFDAATLGDPVATRILEDAGRELGLCATLVAGRIFSRSDEFPLVMGGSVLQQGSSPAMRNAVVATVQKTFPNASPVLLTAPPVLGAGLLALDRLRAISPELVPRTPTELAARLSAQLKESE